MRGQSSQTKCANEGGCAPEPLDLWTLKHEIHMMFACQKILFCPFLNFNCNCTWEGISKNFKHVYILRVSSLHFLSKFGWHGTETLALSSCCVSLDKVLNLSGSVSCFFETLNRMIQLVAPGWHASYSQTRSSLLSHRAPVPRAVPLVRYFRYHPW